MPSTFKQLPAVMNLLVKSGDLFSVDVNFGENLAGRTVTSQIYSLVDYRQIESLSAQVANVTAGTVRVSAASLPPPGTYGWSGGREGRMAISGFIEIVN